MQKKKVISISLGDREKHKVDSLAKAAGLNRSEMFRELIRSKRLPRQPRRESFLKGDLISA